MPLEHLAGRANTSPDTLSGGTEHHYPESRYESEVTRTQLRESLAREGALRRRMDRLIHEHEVVSTLLSGQEDAVARLARLSPQQHNILTLVVAGKPTKNIAYALGISSRTVENHRAQIMHRTGVKSIAELALLAFAAAFYEALEPKFPIRIVARAAQPDDARVSAGCAHDGTATTPFRHHHHGERS